MRAFVRVWAVAALSLALAACQERSPNAPPTETSFAISDGAHSAGNPDFFFLPPMVSNPSSDPNFDPGQFNPSLSPTVVVCALNGAVCGTTVTQFSATSGTGSETIQVDTAGEQYYVNWHTDLSDPPLDPSLTYRITVAVGTVPLGFADVDVVSKGSQLKNVETGEYIGLLDGRTLPIKFRIENQALCKAGEQCTSVSVDLSKGGTLTTPQGDGVVVPPQGADQPIVTFTAHTCADANGAYKQIDVDLPRFGKCLTISVDPPLPEGGLTNAATVFQCDLLPLLPPSETEGPQHELITLYRQDGDVITALPHAAFACPALGLASPPPRNFAEAVWRKVRAVVGTVFGVQPAYALHLGPAGLSGGFSDFQFVLPAQMTPIDGADGQSAAPGDAVAIPPGVIVSDKNGAPVTGATVHFAITEGGGSVVPLTVTSDGTGKAQVASWMLGDAGANQVQASGRGIAGPGDGGPFMPDITPTTGGEAPVAVGTGEVTFNATALSALVPELTLESVVTDGNGNTTYNLDVPNYSIFPDALFAPAPDLPPCGLNTNSSRTWVDIYNQDGARIYGFCALGAAADLNTIWFGVPAESTPPTEVYIVLTDRQTGATYVSNRLNLNP
jgi:hypothetical protein